MPLPERMFGHDWVKINWAALALSEDNLSHVLLSKACCWWLKSYLDPNISKLDRYQRIDALQNTKDLRREDNVSQSFTTRWVVANSFLGDSLSIPTQDTRKHSGFDNIISNVKKNLSKAGVYIIFLRYSTPYMFAVVSDGTDATVFSSKLGETCLGIHDFPKLIETIKKEKCSNSYPNYCSILEVDTTGIASQEPPKPRSPSPILTSPPGARSPSPAPPPEKIPCIDWRDLSDPDEDLLRELFLGRNW